MPRKLKTTWLAVGDGDAAQFYSVHAIPLRLTRVPAGVLKANHKTTHGSDHMPETRKIAHVGNHHGDHQRHEDVFVEHMADTLETAAHGGEFDDVIVVLPPRALAHFRNIVGPDLKKRIKHEICGEWAGLEVPDLERHLAAELP